MHLLPNLLLFLVTLAGGSIPLRLRTISERGMHLLLAFSGSFLLGITFLHLLPEAFADLGTKAGFYMLGGFFLQLLIQRMTHGAEHGHAHVHPHDHAVPLASIITGLVIHAFMEGLPLGFNYRNTGASSALYLAVGAHKLPEAALLTVLVLGMRGKQQAFIILFFFAAVTPAASLLATFLGTEYGFMSRLVTQVIPVVAGAFIHIATTIFFESGTQRHLITAHKVMAMVAGAALASVTLLFE